MDINRQSLYEVQKGFSRLYFENLLEPASQETVARTCTIVPTKNKTETYNWLSRLGRMREWLGERHVRGMEAHDFSITNKKWEYTIGVDRDDIEDDNLGVYRPAILSMAQETNDHYARLVAETLQAGFATACYDGQFFFDTDHPVTSLGTTWSNDGGTNTLTEANLKTALLNVVNITDDQGNPLNINYDTLVVSPVQRFTVKKLLDTELYIHSGDSSVDVNEVAGSIPNVVYNPFLNSTEWYLVDSSKAIKPLVLQIRTRPEFTSIDDPSAEYVFLKDSFAYGVRAKHNTGYALPQLIYGSQGA